MHLPYQNISSARYHKLTNSIRILSHLHIFVNSQFFNISSRQQNAPYCSFSGIGIFTGGEIAAQRDAFPAAWGQQ